MIDLRNRHVCYYNCKYFDFSAAAAVNGSVAQLYCVLSKSSGSAGRCVAVAT